MNKSFLFEGKKVFYRTEGKGKNTLILIHGFPEDGSIFDRQTNYLKDFVQTIVPDLPGSGQSEYNPGLNTVDRFAEVIKALAAQENASNLICIGHSMGGYITLALEANYPTLLKAFGFLHSTALPDSEAKKENRRKTIHIMEEFGAAAFVKKAIPNLFFNTYKAEHPEEIKKLVDRGKNFQTKALQQYQQIMIARPDRTALLRTDKPVFFVIGEEDTSAPLKDLLPQVELPQKAFVHIIGDIAHMGMLEATDKVNRYLKEFIQYV